jgi:hypothetical protein
MSAEVIIGKIVSLAFSAIDRAQGNSAEGQKLKADLERLSEAHMLTPAPLPKQDPADAPYHFCALASLCDDGPRAPEEG